MCLFILKPIPNDLRVKVTDFKKRETVTNWNVFMRHIHICRELQKIHTKDTVMESNTFVLPTE